MNKYQNNMNIDEREIVLVSNVPFLIDEEVKPNRCRRSRPFLILKKLKNNHYLGVNITCINHNVASQYPLSMKNIPDNNIITKQSYASCLKVYEIEDSNIVQEGFILDHKDYDNVLHNIIRLYAVGCDTGTYDQMMLLHEKRYSHRTIGKGCVIKVPYNENYQFIYDEDDNNFICLPLHRDIQEDTQDAVQILRGKSYVNYDEVFHVPKDEIIHVEKSTSQTNPLIEQIKHPEEALELSIYYLRKK